jgi:micrococcal nuclease
VTWAVALALVAALVAGCTSGPDSVDAMPPRTGTATQTAQPEPTGQPRPPLPPEPASGISCNDSGEAIDEDGMVLGFRLWRVTRVIDGDTVEVRASCGRGRMIDVRLIGIDTPETVDPSEPVECYGPEATAFTKRWLEDRLVVLEFDKERIDPFGRTLAYVTVQTGDLFNTLLVRWGFATVATYPPNDKHVRAFERAEARAREHDLGLWSACTSSA